MIDPYANAPHTAPAAERDGPYAPPSVTEDERTWATILHLCILIHIPVASSIVAPLAVLVIWLVKRDESRFLDDHGKEALNFQISLLIYMAAAVVLGFITCGVGWVAILAVWALGIVGLINAVSAARRGQFYRYPMCIRLIG